MATTAGQQRGDMRVFSDSRFYLDQEYVDKFANEVRAAPRPVPVHDDGSGDEDNNNPFSTLQGGDPTDGAPGAISSCTSNWKAAASDEKKRMWGVFDETGVFACACRHGHIMWMSDMIRSGELYVKQSLLIILSEQFHSGRSILLPWSQSVLRSSTVSC